MGITADLTTATGSTAGDAVAGGGLAGLNGANINYYDPTLIGGTPLGGGFDPGLAGGGIYAGMNLDQSDANKYDAQGGATQYNQAPQINNNLAGQQNAQLAGVNAGQNALAGQLSATAGNGQYSQAYQQFQSGAQQSAYANTALGNSAGSGPAAAAARRGGQEQSGLASAQNIAAGTQVAATAQQAAQGQLSSLYGQQGALQNQQYAQNVQLGANNAQLLQQQQSLNDQGMQGYNALTMGEQGQYLGSQEAVNNAQNVANGLYQQGEINTNAQNQLVTGSVLNAGGALAGGLSKAYNDSNSSNAPPQAAAQPDEGDEGGGNTPTYSTDASDFTGSTSDEV
jgi:hypothetical protein